MVWADEDGTEFVSGILELTPTSFDPWTARALGLQADRGKEGAEKPADEELYCSVQTQMRNISRLFSSNRFEI